jgi:hypothetical protein
MKKLSVVSFQFPAKDPLRLHVPGGEPANRKGDCLIAPLHCVFVLVFLLLSACIPANVPANLDDTPGAPVVVFDNIFESAQFVVRYPDGWRVVTSEAQAPLGVIFVAPDEVSTIQLMVGALENANFSNPDLQTEVRGLTLSDGLEMTAVLSAATEHFATYLPLFERVLASLQPT